MLGCGHGPLHAQRARLSTARATARITRGLSIPMSDSRLYFAYGSNLHAPQMESRCPDCRVLQPARLAGYRLAFRGSSTRWGGGSATIVAVPGARVEGLLYALTPADVRKLDGFEGVPEVYEHLAIDVTARDGTPLAAFTYRRLRGEPEPPSLRYFHQIWRGTLAFALDQAPLREAVEEALATQTRAAEGATPAT